MWFWQGLIIWSQNKHSYEQTTGLLSTDWLYAVQQILHIHWSQHVTNADISARTGLPPVMDFIRRRRLSVFGYRARLTQGIPAHNALHFQVGLASGRSLGRDLRRRPGRPRARWTDQLRNDTGSVPANLCRQTGHPTEPRWSDATARAGYAMTTTTTFN